MVFSSHKRFIAGAQCPQCKAFDTVQVFRQEDKDWQECVACGFKQSLDEAGQGSDRITLFDQNS